MPTARTFGLIVLSPTGCPAVEGLALVGGAPLELPVGSLEDCSVTRHPLLHYPPQQVHGWPLLAPASRLTRKTDSVASALTPGRVSGLR